MKKDSITTYNLASLNMSRIAVIGCPGSGKTTFSNRLGALLSREVTHLDKILWQANWQMLPYDERAVIHRELTSGEQWIIDGMWKSHLTERLDRATLVIFLDYKRSVCVYRALKRRVKYSGKQRDDIADGCLEKLDGYFVKYIWTFRRKVRPLIYKLLDEREGLTVVVLKSPKQTERFLEALSQTTNA